MKIFALIYLYLLFVFSLHISFFSYLPIEHFFLPSWHVPGSIMLYEHVELDSYYACHELTVIKA